MRTISDNIIIWSSLICTIISLLATEPGHSGIVEDKYSCPIGWTRYGSKKCLKYVNELHDYDRAQAVCKQGKQGNLVTIHTQDEQNFVYSYIHSIAASSAPIWLGAKQIDFESILWLDKSENTYTNWAPSEPSHPDEICIAINPRNGMWHDVMCTEANVPACERAPTTQWPFFIAFCSEGWFQFNDEKCVRIISSQALNFYESQELCRSKYNSKLLSIKSDRESEFLHNLIKFRDVKLPVWLGAVQNDFSSFNWIDKTDVTFTNWAEGEPNDPDHACLSMAASGGKWSDNDCKEQKLILCQKSVPDESTCEQGWLQFRQDKCYRFVHIRLAFDDAETLCNNLYGGHLPSIHSQEEQYMITQFLASVNVKNGSEIWLGGRQMDFHNYNWGDGSMFNYSYWDHGEPNFPAEKCIEMSWRNGRWNDINCRLKRAVLCEKTVTSRHLSIKPQSNPNHPLQYLNCEEANCTTTVSTTSSSPSSVVPPIQSVLLSNTTNNITNHLLATTNGTTSQQQLDSNNNNGTLDPANLALAQTNTTTGNDTAENNNNSTSVSNMDQHWPSASGYNVTDTFRSGGNNSSDSIHNNNYNYNNNNNISSSNNSNYNSNNSYLGQVTGEGVAIPLSVSQLIATQQNNPSMSGGALADLLSPVTAGSSYGGNVQLAPTLDEANNQASEQKASPVISSKPVASYQTQQQQSSVSLTNSLVTEHPKQPQYMVPVMPIVSTFDSSVVVPSQQQQQQSPAIVTSNSEPLSGSLVKSTPSANVVISNNREIINKLQSPQSTNVNVDTIKPINDYQPSIPKQLKEILPS